MNRANSKVDFSRFEKDGKYAASMMHQSVGIFDADIGEGFSVLRAEIAAGIPYSPSAYLWSLDFLESALWLLGFDAAAAIVREDVNAAEEIWLEQRERRLVKVG